MASARGTQGAMSRRGREPPLSRGTDLLTGFSYIISIFIANGCCRWLPKGCWSYCEGKVLHAAAAEVPAPSRNKGSASRSPEGTLAPPAMPNAFIIHASLSLDSGTPAGSPCPALHHFRRCGKNARAPRFPNPLGETPRTLSAVPSGPIMPLGRVILVNTASVAATARRASPHGAAFAVSRCCD